jgi:hypothetical protein
MKTRFHPRLLLLMALFFGTVAIGTLIATRPPADPFHASAIKNPAYPSLTYSIQAFLWWDTGHVGTHLDWVTFMSFNHIKHTFAWRDMEPEPGVWTFHQSDRILAETERRGIQVIARLGQAPAWAAGLTEIADTNMEKTDYPPQDLATWVNYCRTVATRYAGRISGYQIWNEPNLSREWGNQPPDAADYTQLLAACSTVIREVDPTAKIISAGLAPTGTHDDTAHRDDIYLDALYRAGFQAYVDAVGVHAPGFTPPAYGPDDAEKDGRGRWATFRRVEDLRKIMVQHNDAARQMAILEMGWTVDTQNPAYAWYAVTEAQQAHYMVEGLQYIHEHWSPWVGLVSIIYLPNIDWTEADEEYWWAIAYPNFFTRPVYGELVRMAKYCDDYFIPERTDVTEEGILGTLDACP